MVPMVNFKAFCHCLFTFTTPFVKNALLTKMRSAISFELFKGKEFTTIIGVDIIVIHFVYMAPFYVWLLICGICTHLHAML